MRIPALLVRGPPGRGLVLGDGDGLAAADRVPLVTVDVHVVRVALLCVRELSAAIAGSLVLAAHGDLQTITPDPDDRRRLHVALQGIELDGIHPASPLAYWLE